MILERADRLSPEQQAQVHALAERVAAEAGTPPLNDESLLRLGEVVRGLVHLCLRADGELVGYAQLHDGVAELAVGAEHAARLLDAAEGADDQVTVWTHGVRSPVAPLLDSRGYARTRLLHQLRLPLNAGPLPAIALPAGIRVRPFQVGADEDAWLRVNAAAFAEHAEQGDWTRADLDGREAELWFDPAGFFLAWRDGALLGFHWTKIHPDATGEVYVLGIDPAAQGLHLGAALLVIGLRHLTERGCPYALLYVDDTNTAAVRLYERFGFTRHDLDAQWRREGTRRLRG